MSTLSSGDTLDHKPATATSLLTTQPPTADDAADDDWQSEQHFQSDDENGPEDYYIEPPRTPSARRSSPAASPRFAADSEAIEPGALAPVLDEPTRSPRTALLDDDDAESGDSTSWVGRQRARGEADVRTRDGAVRSTDGRRAHAPSRGGTRARARKGAGGGERRRGPESDFRSRLAHR